MAQLLIQDEGIAWRLLDIARRESRPVEAVLESLLEHYEPTAPIVEDEPQPGTFAALAAAARRANLSSPEPVDTSERSREILNTEYADYLKRRMDEQQSSDTD